MTNPRSLLLYAVNLDNDYKVSLGSLYRMVGRSPGVLAVRSTTVAVNSGDDVSWSAVHYDYGTHWDVNTPYNFYINDSYITHVKFNIGIRTTLNNVQRFRLYLNNNTTSIASTLITIIDYDSSGSSFRKCLNTGPIPVSSGDFFNLKYAFGNTASVQAHANTYFNMMPWRFA